MGFRSPSRVARRLRLAPVVSHAIENWPSFMYHYALGLTPKGPYRFRSGARLAIGRGVDHVPIIEIFLRHDYGAVPPNAVIVDLGANIGAFSIYAATTANVRVYAYEPTGVFFRLLESNVRLNRLNAAVSCFNVAVAGTPGERELAVAGEALHFPTLVPPPSLVARTSERVPCTTLAAILDENGLARVDLLKMDIEGAEYETLYATPASFFARIREIRLEYHQLDDDVRNARRLKAFLLAQGYLVARDLATSPSHGNLWVTRND